MAQPSEKKGEVVKRMLICVGVVAVIGAAGAGLAGAGSANPFKAKDTGLARIVNGSGTVVQTADVGVGTATHLGRFTLEAGETIDLATGAVTEGFFTLTGANGDTVSGSYSGQALPGLTGYVVSGPVTGGTGRFAGATGFLIWDGTIEGAIDPLTLRFSDVITGAIFRKGE